VIHARKAPGPGRFFCLWSRFVRSTLLAIVFAVFSALPLLAFDGQILLPNGEPAAQCQVSVVGKPGSVRADANGLFTVAPTPPLPFMLLVIGARGEIYNPVEVTSVDASPAVIRLEAGYIEQVTVTSGVAPNILASPAAATSVVARDDLEQRKPEHLVEALERTAGIARRGEGPAAVPVVRGLSGGRTLILIDDGRVTAERRAGASATFLNPFILGSVEVARGPGSVSYGSDAFGGVIHARPRDPVPNDGRLRYELSASLGGSDLKSAGIEWSQALFGGAILGAVYGRSSDGSEAADGIEIANSAYDDRGATLRFVRSFPESTFRVGLSVDQGRDIEAPAADALVQRTFYPEENSSRLTASWDGMHVAGFESVEVRAALAGYEIATNRERLPASGVTRQINNSTVDADDVSMRVTGFRSIGSGRLSSGVDFQSRFGLRATGYVERFDETGAFDSRETEVSIDDARRSDAGLFVTYDLPLTSSISTSFGLRGDYVESRNRGGYFGDVSHDDSALSGHAAITYNMTSELTASLQAARGYREPTISDRYFRGVSGRGFVVGNPGLEPEQSLQFDGALRWQRHRSALALYAYHYTIEDLIERYRSGADFAFRNRGEAEIKGTELELTLPVGPTLTVQATATWARGEALDDDAPLDDIPGPNGHLALRWAHGRAYVFAHGFFFAEDDRPGPVETSRPAHETFDLGAGWRFSELLELRVHARNILDENYAGSPDANAALAPGRSVTVFIGGVAER
jgi:outer membrane receptor protein involved in Fe transport